MHEVLTTITSYLSVHWPQIVTIATSGAVVSIVLQLIKHFGKLQDAQRLIMLLLGVLSTAATFADQLITFNSQNPNFVAVNDLGWVVAAAVFVHRFAVSPVYYKVVNFLNGVYADASKYRQEHPQLAGTSITASPAGTPNVTITTEDAQPHEFTIPQ